MIQKRVRTAPRAFTAPVPFNDLRLDKRRRREVDAAIRRVLDGGWFILGPELEAFEQEFAAFHSVAYAVGVASGTDAVELALRAGGIGPGDEVVTPSHTAVPTVCAIERAGAKPVFVDVDPVSGTIDPIAVNAAVGPHTAAIVAVHLYGHPADMPALMRTADRHNLWLVEDCAQAHGARIDGRLVGTFGHAAAFSFYPTKNMGALGDAGAVITDDADAGEQLRRLRNYGQSSRYHCQERGVNSRLDEIQAAVLRVQLCHLEEDNLARRRLADEYAKLLRGVEIPTVAWPEYELHHVYHLYVVQHPRRDALRQRLQEQGVGTQIHYPVPVHLQPAYADLGYRKGSLPVTERLCDRILSLPMHPGLGRRALQRVADAVADSTLEAA